MPHPTTFSVAGRRRDDDAVYEAAGMVATTLLPHSFGTPMSFFQKVKRPHHLRHFPFRGNRSSANRGSSQSRLGNLVADFNPLVSEMNFFAGPGRRLIHVLIDRGHRGIPQRYGK